MRQSEFLHNNAKLIPCSCGCGELIKEYTTQGVKARFKLGHSFKGKHFTEEHREKISHSHTGIKFSKEHIMSLSLSHRRERSSAWKGDNVGMRGLHNWIDTNLPKQKLCQICKLVPPRDCANITGIYNRDFKNWMRICRKCHMISDNRIIRNLKPFRNGHKVRAI